MPQTPIRWPPHYAQEVTALAKDPQWRAGNIHPLPPPQRTLIDTITIPLWLASHFGVVRLAGWIYGRDPVNYAAPLFAY